MENSVIVEKLTQLENREEVQRLKIEALERDNITIKTEFKPMKTLFNVIVYTVMTAIIAAILGLILTK
jgi:hypothetical protein